MTQHHYLYCMICSALCWLTLPFLAHSKVTPVFLAQPQDTEVREGSIVRLDCKIQLIDGIDSNQLKVQWLRKGFGLGEDRSLPEYPRYRMDGAVELGEYNLFIANAQLEDDERFRCQVGESDKIEGVQSQVAFVTVLVPPVTPVIKDASKVRDLEYRLQLVQGTLTQITCEAKNGRPAASITWKVNEVETAAVSSTVQAEGKLEHATSILEFTATRADQGTKIECLAKNKALDNNKNQLVYVDVLYSPEVTISSSAKQVKESGQISITCKGDAKPSAITWKWKKGDTDLDETSDTLVLENIQREDHSALVTCLGTNTVGTNSQSMTLSVQYGPRFTSDAVLHPEIDMGGEATLVCKAESNPEPVIFWTKKGSSRMISQGSTLHITDAKKYDFGIYICRATTFGFDDISREIHLLENDKPEITSATEQSARYGETGIVECSAISVPSPSQVIWSKGAEPIDFSNNPRYIAKQEASIGGQRSWLEIASVQDKDFVTFNCTVVNARGEDTLMVTFFKKEVVSFVWILLGVLLGVVIIIAVAIALFIYYRRRKGNSVYGSDSSENTLQKKDVVDGKLESVMPYRDNLYVANPIDPWGTGAHLVHNPYDRRPYVGHSLEHEPHQHKPRIGFGDPYHNASQYGPQNSTLDIYGTYPGRRAMEPKYAASDYGHPSNMSDYGTYGRSRRPRYAGSDFGSPPPASLDTRLATNV